MWLCKKIGHFLTGGWVHDGMFHQECKLCGKIISENIKEAEMNNAKEPMFTDREWGEAKMFGQYEQRANREEVVVFSRVDLCAYATMLRQYDAEIRPDGFQGLTLEEVEDIIKSNITITDQRLYEGVYAVAVDIEMALKNKNDEFNNTTENKE
jgi:hypothetical protein